MSLQASLSANARARFKRHLCHALLYAVLLVMAAVGATPLPKRIAACLSSRFGRVRCVAEPLCLLLLLLLATAYLVDGSFNPFLYFRF